MNNVFLSGRLTKDPEIRYTPSKKAVCTFTLAVDGGKTKDGERITQFIPCVAWEHTAEMLDQYFSKGDGLTAFGRLQMRSYEQDGKKRTVCEVIISGIEFPLSKKEKKGDAPQFKDIDDDGEIPF